MGLALAKVKSDPDGVGHHEEDAGDEEHGEQRAFPASIERAEAPSDPVVTKMKSESSRLNSKRRRGRLRSSSESPEQKRSTNDREQSRHSKQFNHKFLVAPALIQRPSVRSGCKNRLDLLRF